jgi:hypothetical protein
MRSKGVRGLREGSARSMMGVSRRVFMTPSCATWSALSVARRFVMCSLTGNGPLPKQRAILRINLG